MCQEKKKKKYYLIRKDIFWRIILSVVLFMLVVIFGKEFLKNQIKMKMPKKIVSERIEVAFDGQHSVLKDTEQCYLCGHNDRSLMSYYSQFDTLGLIFLNDWYVLDFQLTSYDEQENEAESDKASRMHFGNSGEIIYSSTGIPAKGIAKIELTLPEEYNTDTFFYKGTCVKSVWIR